MSDDLWAEASSDLDAEHATLSMNRAKVSVASLWPFLAMASNVGEFEHRLAIAADTINDRVPAELMEPVLGSLRQDFLAITAADGDADGDDDGSDPGDGDAEDSSKPWEKSAAQEPNQSDAIAHMHREKRHEDFFNHMMGPEFHPNFSGGDILPEPGEAQMRDKEVPWGDHEQGHWPHVDTDEYGSYLDHFDPHEQPHIQSMNSRRTAEYFDQGLGRWVAINDNDGTSGQGNPAYFTGGPEAGPMTGETNQFPQFPGGPDNHESPLNVEYPMQPSPWTVPPGGEWVERPMEWTTASRLPFNGAKILKTETCEDCGHPAEHVENADGVRFWSHGGERGQEADADHVPWPSGKTAGYFDQGSEGVAGDGQSGFPADQSQPEEDYRVDEYGAVPPAQSSGTTGDEQDNSYHSAAVHTEDSPEPHPGTDPNGGTEFASTAERERYEKLRAVSSTGNIFYDPNDHGVRMVASDADPYMGDNPYSMDAGNSGNPNDGGTPPGPPPAMDGGPGATGTTPMQSNVPQTTSPRQMPSGGGDPGMAPSTASQRHADSRDVFSDSDPTGLGDEYRERQITHQMQSRPRQSPEQRGVNTPQKPPQPIRTLDTSVRPAEREGDDDDDRDED